MKIKETNKIGKIILLMLLLILISFLKPEVYANASELGIYGKDYFGEEYSNGYIRDRNQSNIIRTSSGISLKNGIEINPDTWDGYKYMKFFSCDNTEKSEYIDFSEAARTINENGEPVWLDMRIYFWVIDKNHPWAFNKDQLDIKNLYAPAQRTTMEFHFYTAGHCGESDYEKSFKGITKLGDSDQCEGYLLYSGYNKYYVEEGNPLVYVPKGGTNVDTIFNPFDIGGISEYPYFFGTQEDYKNDIWVEVNSTPESPFKIQYGTTHFERGSNLFYMGTVIEYYVDGVLKDTSYCVPYGTYRLINPAKLDSQQEGYTIDGWYTDTNYKTKAANGIAGGSAIRVYGKSIQKETYTITVDNDRYGHTYNTYQVFEGNYYEKVDESGNKITTLSNIEWGTELKKETEDGKTHGDKILGLLKEKNLEIYNDCNTAEDVAKVLQENKGNGDITREFTDIVGKYILDNNISKTDGTSTLVEKKDETGNVIDSNYQITHLDPGYYIVIDAEANPKDDAYSRYFIDVVQNVTMEPKTSIPKINKKVIGNNLKTLVDESYVVDDKRNTATYKTEDYDVEFELKSYIPNADGYSTYKFEIVDILAKGFDYDRNSIKVMLGSTEYPKTRSNESGETADNYTIQDVVITVDNYNEYKNYFEEEGKEYSEGYKESQYGKTLILIKINDLVEQIKAGIVEKAQDVIVRYNAKLNGKGETGNTPNVNEAYLKYSNNPYNNEQITQTTTEITYTYTIDLNLDKIAELKPETDEKIYLSGAEFEIYNKPNTVESREVIATITTDELGQALYSSLGAGTYYLKEVKSPEGYNKLREEIEIEVTATCDEFGTITWQVSDKTNNGLILAQIGVKEGTAIPEIKLQVENKSGFNLPVTGGKGTIIFTIIGLSIMLIVIISLKSNKKK